MQTPFELNIRHLDAVQAIAQRGSLNAAAEAVNMSQPALTQALAKLEKGLGHRLFDRQASGATPTGAGRLFLPRIERGLDQLRVTVRRLRRAAQKPAIQYFERLTSMGHLEAYAAVDRTGSYVMAAQSLGIAQPSVHRAVKELEATLDIPLLERIGRAVRPTSTGARLIIAIRLMASELQAGIDELALLATSGSARIRIGALPLSRAGLLPDSLAPFTREKPQVRVTIIEAPYEELLASLLSAEIDLFVGALRDTAPTRLVTQEPLFKDDLFIVARAGHPLSHARKITALQLATYPWIVGAEKSPMRRQWDAIFKDVETPKVQIESGSVLLARGLITNGDWLALMSRDQFRIEQATGFLTTIGRALPGSQRVIGVTTRADWMPNSAQAALIHHLKLGAASRTSAF